MYAEPKLAHCISLQLVTKDHLATTDVYTQSKNNIHRLVDLLSYQSNPKLAKAKKEKRSKSSMVGNFLSEFETQTYVNMII